MDTSLSRPTPRPHVFCCPFAGGSSTAFQSWLNLDPAIDVVGLDYPGRMLRDEDPMLLSVDAIADQLTREIASQTEASIALFGISLGALVALEIAYRLEEAGRSPACLVLCACVAPERVPRQLKIIDSNDEVFFDRLSERYGGAICAFSNDPEARNLIIRYLRGDIETFENYVFTERAPLKSKIIVATGNRDSTVRFSDILDWRKHSTKPVEFITIEGDHFFAQNYSSIIAERLRRSLIGNSGA